ncbi:hypothetical protein F4778DRAFT_723465 [Xylariomycetidae sp. FL2044]|nr:hypothetical protein F4778DRAFT_723465 [Xylariomycetidae sp. FL2044]
MPDAESISNHHQDDDQSSRGGDAHPAPSTDMDKRNSSQLQTSEGPEEALGDTLFTSQSQGSGVRAESSVPPATAGGVNSQEREDDGERDQSANGSDDQSHARLLHTAIHGRNTTVLHHLLLDGADIEAVDESGAKPLYFAADLGYLEAVELLLFAGASEESVNDETHLTALHRAVENKHMRIAETLLQYGASANGTGLAPRTPLTTAVEHHNIEMVQLLLRYGADKDAVDRSGSTAFTLAEGSDEILSILRGPQLLQGPSTGLSHPQAPTPGQFRVPKHNTDKRHACRGFRAMVVDFFIQGKNEYRIEKTMPVFELIYGAPAILKHPESSSLSGKKQDLRWYHLPANNIEWVEDLISRRLTEDGKAPQRLSDEFKMAAGLIGTHDRHHATVMDPSPFMRPTCRSFRISPDGGQSIQEHVVVFTPYLHFEARPRFETMAKSLESVLDRRKRQSGKKDRSIPTRAISRPDSLDTPLEYDPERLYKHMLNGYLLTASPGKAGPLQLRRTLDQYFYTHLDTTGRDNDQVVYRYTKSSKLPKMFMVDQLWLWVLNDDTVISCAPVDFDSPIGDSAWRMADPHQPSPQPGVAQENTGSLAANVPRAWGRSKARKRTQRPAMFDFPFGHPEHSQPHRHPFNEGGEEDSHLWIENFASEMKFRPLNVHHNILRYLRTTHRPQISSPYQLASVIANLSANVFDDHKIPPEFQFFDFFERSISKVTDRATWLLRLFKVAAEVSFERVQEQLGIADEAQLLVEIEDIQDELSILRMVLTDQQAILRGLGRTWDQIGHDRHHYPASQADYLSLDENRVLGNHLHRINTMEKIARKTTKTLLSLLDLKQKQANMAQVLSSVDYARQGVMQAEETARQGRTLTLFTVVTIVFLPLSFMAAFFAIEIDAFPWNENGKLALGYVLKYMLSISAALSVPFIFIAFNQDRIPKWLDNLSSLLGRQNLLWLCGALVVLLVILTSLWTSSVGYMAKIAVTVAAVLLAIACLAGVGISRFVHVDRQSGTIASTES